MKSWQKPTAEQVETAIAKLGHDERLWYFFEHLENPLWLPFLQQRHFFDRPPPTERDPTGKGIAFPGWAATRYLARIANYPDMQTTVLEVALAIPETENTRVHEDLADIALQLPAPLAARLVTQASKWVASGYLLLLPEKLGALVAHLAAGDELSAAIKLAKQLLAVKPGADAQASSARNSPFPPEPRPLFDQYHYQEILKKHIPVLIEKAETDGLQVLIDVLTNIQYLSIVEPKKALPEDHSHIYRETIDEGAEYGGVRDALISAIRDGAAALAAKDNASVPTIVASLKLKRWRIFRRLALWVLSKYPDADPARGRAHLLDRDLMIDYGYRAEYNALATTGFKLLSDPEKAEWLQTARSGSKEEIYRKNYEA